MKRQTIALILAAFPAASPSAILAMSSVGTVDVYFSLSGGATETVVTEKGRAKFDALVQAYSFTNKPIAKALLR